MTTPARSRPRSRRLLVVVAGLVIGVLSFAAVAAVAVAGGSDEDGGAASTTIDGIEYRLEIDERSVASGERIPGLLIATNGTDEAVVVPPSDGGGCRTKFGGGRVPAESPDAVPELFFTMECSTAAAADLAPGESHIFAVGFEAAESLGAQPLPAGDYLAKAVGSDGAVYGIAVPITVE